MGSRYRAALDARSGAVLFCGLEPIEEVVAENTAGDGRRGEDGSRVGRRRWIELVRDGAVRFLLEVSGPDVFARAAALGQPSLISGQSTDHVCRRSFSANSFSFNIANPLSGPSPGHEFLVLSVGIRKIFEVVYVGRQQQSHCRGLRMEHYISTAGAAAACAGTLPAKRP